MGKKLSNSEYKKIKKNIIKKLYSCQAFIKGHLLFERLTSGIPPHLKGFVEKVLNDLIKKKLYYYIIKQNMEMHIN